MRDEWNDFPAIAEALEDELAIIVEKTAEGVVQVAQSRAPVRTGFLRDSIYYTTSTKSTYGRDVGEVPAGASLLSPIEAPTEKTSVNIGVAANYGMFVELGTRYMAAQPYLAPAISAMQGPFQDALNFIEDGLKGHIA